MTSMIEESTVQPVRYRSGRVRLGAATVAAALLLSALALAGWYRLSYHTFDWRAAPPRIGYCGRDYDRAATTSTEAAFRQRRLVRVHPFPPLLHPLYVEVNPLAAVGADICPMTLDYEFTRATMVTYGLVGGP